MANPGSAVVLPNGTRAVLSTGNRAILNTEGECRPCCDQEFCDFRWCMYLASGQVSQFPTTVTGIVFPNRQDDGAHCHDCPNQVRGDLTFTCLPSQQLQIELSVYCWDNGSTTPIGTDTTDPIDLTNGNNCAICDNQLIDVVFNVAGCEHILQIGKDDRCELANRCDDQNPYTASWLNLFDREPPWAPVPTTGGPVFSRQPQQNTISGWGDPPAWRTKEGALTGSKLILAYTQDVTTLRFDWRVTCHDGGTNLGATRHLRLGHGQFNAPTTPQSTGVGGVNLQYSSGVVVASVRRTDWQQIVGSTTRNIPYDQAFDCSLVVDWTTDNYTVTVDGEVLYAGLWPSDPGGSPALYKFVKCYYRTMSMFFEGGTMFNADINNPILVATINTAGVKEF